MLLTLVMRFAPIAKAGLSAIVVHVADQWGRKAGILKKECVKHVTGLGR